MAFIKKYRGKRMKNILPYKSIKSSVEQLINAYFPLQNIINALHSEGGVIYLVGGSVRDLFLKASIKDLDIEVHKLSLQQLESILLRFGMVNAVGKSFGVLRLENLPIDWSLPRIDEAGRKPHVKIDPWLDIKTAFERRDLTINAMGINLISFEPVDPFNGLDDLQKGVLRTPNPRFFIEDPLRFYRVMQFIGRFEMYPDLVLTKVCRLMDIAHVSKERIESEFKKLLLQSKKPSCAMRWLVDIGRIAEVLPELAAMQGVLQEPDWHPEGDVFEHTLQTIDAAASYDYSSQKEKLVILYACLCHDLGKVVTTKLIKGRLTAYEHAKQGVYYTKNLLKRITSNKLLIDGVCKLVNAHLYPFEFVVGNAGSGAYKRLALKLSPDVTIVMLSKVALADKQGRNIYRGVPLTIPQPQLDMFLKNAERAGVLTSIEMPILHGKDLMPEVEPGPRMGILVKKAYAIQLSEGIKDKIMLKNLVLGDD